MPSPEQLQREMLIITEQMNIHKMKTRQLLAKMRKLKADQKLVKAEAKEHRANGKRLTDEADRLLKLRDELRSGFHT